MIDLHVIMLLADPVSGISEFVEDEVSGSVQKFLLSSWTVGEIMPFVVPLCVSQNIL